MEYTFSRQNLRDSRTLEAGRGSRVLNSAFWDEFTSERGFEGLVVHTDGGEEYKIKFRDTLDVAIIAFRMTGSGRPMCERCGVRFDTFWLRKLARDGKKDSREMEEDDTPRKGSSGVPVLAGCSDLIEQEGTCDRDERFFRTRTSDIGKGLANGLRR